MSLKDASTYFVEKNKILFGPPEKNKSQATGDHEDDDETSDMNETVLDLLQTPTKANQPPLPHSVSTTPATADKTHDLMKPADECQRSYEGSAERVSADPFADFASDYGDEDDEGR